MGGLSVKYKRRGGIILIAVVIKNSTVHTSSAAEGHTMHKSSTHWTTNRPAQAKHTYGPNSGQQSSLHAYMLLYGRGGVYRAFCPVPVLADHIFPRGPPTTGPRPLFNYKQTIFGNIWRPQILYVLHLPSAQLCILATARLLTRFYDQKFIGAFFAPRTVGCCSCGWWWLALLVSDTPRWGWSRWPTGQASAGSPFFFYRHHTSGRGTRILLPFAICILPNRTLTLALLPVGGQQLDCGWEAG